MAGPFGFEADKFEVSKAIAQEGLLPAVEAAAEETLIVADGFSCREQIDQLTDRKAMHFAEVLARAPATETDSKARIFKPSRPVDTDGRGNNKKQYRTGPCAKRCSQPRCGICCIVLNRRRLTIFANKD
jgi:hypothetical protein